ncbi:hypothetical protein [Shinella zoogloeoides]|uniref:hypothetical protein n=1 Tax=Shinella zoogloeoides TaxID=352475 RepID=UPI00299D6E2D|nr:hypothetical protein [Shinella zoogloeoides]WPE22460.1 hypothetical protein ShzoTeo12_36760 [Shinella zoogloeoides]
MTVAAEMTEDLIDAAAKICRGLGIASTPTNCLPIIEGLKADRQRDQWQPISEADRSIATVQTFPDVSITLRNSYPVWVRDEDGRVYEAVWSEGTANYWWDLEGESPVDPVEFMPHPLDPRFAAPKGGDHHG